MTTQVNDRSVALITGASQGIGFTVAKRLAEAGYAIALVAIDNETLHAAAAEISKIAPAIAYGADLANTSQIPDIVSKVVADFGRLDVVFNGAGATKRGALDDLSDADWIAGFSVKFFGTVAFTRAAWPHLKENHGSLINIAGALAHTPNRESLIGGAICSALHNFTKAIAEQGRLDGVQVNSINPGWIDTGRLESQLESKAKKAGHNDRARAASDMISELQISRFGQPDDVAGLVLYLLSKGGSFVHGASLDIDGGLTKGI